MPKRSGAGPYPKVFDHDISPADAVSSMAPATPIKCEFVCLE